MPNFESNDTETPVSLEVEALKNKYVNLQASYTEARKAMDASIAAGKGLKGEGVMSSEDFDFLIKELAETSEALTAEGVDVEALVGRDVKFSEFSPEQIKSDINSAIEVVKKELGSKFTPEYPLLEMKVEEAIADKYGLSMVDLFDTSGSPKAEITRTKIARLMGTFSTEVVDEAIEAYFVASK